MATDWLRAKEKFTIGGLQICKCDSSIGGGSHIETIATVGVTICAVVQCRTATRVGRADLGHFWLPKMPITGEATSTMSFQSTQASVVGLNDPSTTSSVTSTPSSRGRRRMVLGGSGVTYFLMGITALTSSNWLSKLNSC